MWRCLLALLCHSSPARPEYDRHELYELVALAERVVAGTITAVQEQTFDLMVEHDLLGGNPGARLHLERFSDWTCAMRWDEYQVGQRVVLFLTGNQAMGAGDEGDWPIVEGQVLAPYRIHGFEWKSVSPGARELHGTALSLEELGQAIRGYRRCFANSLERSGLRLRFALDEAAALEYARSSALAQHLHEETLSSPALVESDALPVPPALDVAPLATVRGGGGMFATGMVSLGDLNADGWDDLAIRESGVWIVELDGGGNLLRKTPIDADVLGPGLYFGEGLTPIGDFDGDGIPDLAVSAPAKEDNGRGVIGLLLLMRDGSLKKALVLSSEALELNPAIEAGFAAALVSVGDLDGNGTRDLLVDARNIYAFHSFRGDEAPKPHVLPLLFLDPNGSVPRTANLDAKDIHGRPYDVTFARAMVELGDLDGDGLSEVAIGHAYDDDGGEYRGAVYIVSLERSGALRSKSKISDWSGAFEARLMDNDEFGLALAAPGDLDGDGVPDLIVGGAKEIWILHLARDGTTKRFEQFGARAGGFVPVDRILSLAVLDGPGGERRLAMGGRLEVERQESCVWMLKLGAGTLSKP